MKIGMDILQKEEKVEIDSIVGHGGIFKTPVVGQRVLAAVMNAPVTVMETAGEGGAWGIALLAAYLVNQGMEESLASYLANHVFVNDQGTTIAPVAKDVAGFDEYVKRYATGLPIEKAAIDHLI